MKNDRTLQAIGRQLKAMGCERFDIGVRDATTGQMMNREWSAAEVLQNTPWLKRMNAQGNDVYIRPAEQERHGLVLVDDLSEFDLDDMKAEGREPALVVETSPKNYQAWVKVADAAGGELRGQIARTLASEYDADPASAAVPRKSARPWPRPAQRWQSASPATKRITSSAPSARSWVCPASSLRGPSWHGHRHPASEAWTGAGQISACSACVGTHACYTMSTHAQKGVLWNTKKALQGRST